MKGGGNGEMESFGQAKEARVWATFCSGGAHDVGSWQEGEKSRGVSLWTVASER